MDLKKRIDPELAPALDMAPFGDFSDIQTVRTMSDKIFAEMAALMPPVKGVRIENKTVPGPKDSPDVNLRVYSPEKQLNSAIPGLLWIHGGGYIAGNLEIDDYSMKQICLKAECVIVAVNYRLAPENPFPAPLEDCYAALKWMAGENCNLNIDKSRIAIGGGSAGGGLAAGLAILARDRAEVKIIFQMLIYPMLDCRNISPSSYAITDPRTWDREKNIFGWNAYLGSAAGSADISPYASPSCAKDLSGLPPAYIAVGELDLFLDEDIDYAQGLLQAGISTELHVYPGATHGFDGMANATVSKRYIQERDDAIQRALKIRS